MSHYRSVVRPLLQLEKRRPAQGQEEAVFAYKRQFWDPCKCEEMPPALAMMFLDGMLTHGTNKAVTMLQRCLEREETGQICEEDIEQMRKTCECGQEGLLRKFLGLSATAYTSGESAKEQDLTRLAEVVMHASRFI
jgi:lysozyme family protein